MVDGVLLLVDASEGPAAADPLRAAQGARGAAAGRARGEQGRPPGRAAEEVVDEVYELFLDLDADESQIEFPIVYCNAREGRAGLARRRPGRRSDAALRRRCSRRCRRRRTTPSTRCRRSSRTSTRRRTSAGSRCCRVMHGTLRKGAADRLVPRRRHDRDRAGRPSCYVTEALDRVPADEAGPGRDRRARRPARRDDRRDDRRPGRSAAAARHRRRRAVALDDARDQHVAARGPRGRQADGERRCKARLDQELVGNVSLRVGPTSRPDVWEVQGRGELQLAVLVELMRREGFELTVGKPEVLTKERRRQACTSRSSGSRSTCPRSTSASSRSCSRCARAACSRWSTTAPAGRGWSTSCPRAA